MKLTKGFMKDDKGRLNFRELIIINNKLAESQTRFKLKVS